MKKTLLPVITALVCLASAVQADILYATDTARASLQSPDTLKGAVTTTRGDSNAYKTWIKFDVSGLDIGSLTSADLRLTLTTTRASFIDVWGVNDSYTNGMDWTASTLTWNNAPGNYTSADGTNSNQGATQTQLRQELNSNATKVGSIAFDGTPGDQYTIDVLSLLQADSDGIVQIAIGNGSYTTWGYAGSALDSDKPALVTAIPEPATLGLVGVFGAGVLFVRRRLTM